MKDKITDYKNPVFDTDEEFRSFHLLRLGEFHRRSRGVEDLERYHNEFAADSDRGTLVLDSESIPEPRGSNFGFQGRALLTAQVFTKRFYPVRYGDNSYGRQIVVRWTHNYDVIQYKKQVPSRMHKRVEALREAVVSDADSALMTLLGGSVSTNESGTVGYGSNGYGFYLKFAPKKEVNKAVWAEVQRQLLTKVCSKVRLLTEQLRQEMDPFLTKRPMKIGESRD